jgi:iron uptake system component EfeO
MMLHVSRGRWLAALFASAAMACAGDGPEELERRALLGVKADIDADLVALHGAAVALRAAAPAPDADGWSASADGAAVDAMKAEWKRARTAYERIEGAIAVLFPDLDVATDERYEGFLESGPDTNLFDGEGVTGVHAIERILWADRHPPDVVAFERGLSGYSAAAFPANATEAADFADGLLARLERDTETMMSDFAPLALDPASAYRGVIGSMGEQVEKVALASTGESESRYADYTLTDMRANLAGGRTIYARFTEWLEVAGGGDLAVRIEAAFARIEGEYERHPGDAIPPVPPTWNPDAPSPADLATEYGKLWSLLEAEADPAVATSLVSMMTAGGDLLGIPSLPE